MAWRTVPCDCGNGRQIKYDGDGNESGDEPCWNCGGSREVQEQYGETDEPRDYGNCDKCGSSLSRNGFCTNSHCP